MPSRSAEAVGRAEDVRTPSRRTTAILMRALPLLLASCVLLGATQALAADPPPPEVEATTPPPTTLGGASPFAPGTLTVAPTEVQLPAVSNSTSDEFTFDYHGYFRAPLIVSLGSRCKVGDPPPCEAVAGDHASTTFHSPAAVPDRLLGTWLYNNNIAPSWANVLLSYGNRMVRGTVGLNAFNFTTAQDSGQSSGSSTVSLGPVYLHFNLPDLLGPTARVDWDVGAFSNRYGTAGKYDYGAYGMYLFGATGTIGETVGIETDIADPITLRLEHGIGANYYVTGTYATALLHHAHLFAGYRQLWKIGLHYLTTWTNDERAPASPTDPGGRITVFGADTRFNGGIFGEVYFGLARANVTTATHIGPVLYSMNALGGVGFRDNFFGPNSNGSGSVTTLLFQYDYSFGALARYIAHYPRKYWQDGPDLRLSLFGTASWVSVPDETHPPPTAADPNLAQLSYDGTKKLKLGGELTYSLLPSVSLATRVDRVMPTSKDGAQSYTVLSPKIILRTNFFTHEQVLIQYSRYYYGSSYPKLASCGTSNTALEGCRDIAGQAATIDDSYNSKLDPRVTGRYIPYDSHVIYVSATMWW
jgi:hypothetical protein